MFVAVAKYKVELSVLVMNIWLIILEFCGIQFIDGLHNKSLWGDMDLIDISAIIYFDVWRGV